jgi:hypothetical protein
MGVALSLDQRRELRGVDLFEREMVSASRRSDGDGFV